MDEKPDQIIGHIEAQREELGRNLNELETRVRRTTDWRTHFDKNPMMMIGAALGGGILLGSIVSGRTHRSRAWSGRSRYTEHTGETAGAGAGAAAAARTPGSVRVKRPSGPATSIQRSRINDTMDQIKAALIAFGIAKAKEFLSEAIPGFDRHLDEAERSRSEHRSNVSGSTYSSSSPRDFRTHTESSQRRTEPTGATTPTYP